MRLVDRVLDWAWGSLGRSIILGFALILIGGSAGVVVGSIWSAPTHGFFVGGLITLILAGLAAFRMTD